MYTRKRMTALLAACLMAALTACGGSKPAADTAPAGQGAAEETAAETAAPEETAAPAETSAEEAATEETTAAEAAETGAGAGETAADLYTCDLEKHPLSEEEDGYLLAEGGYMTISLPEETAAAYPQLQAALDAYDQDMAGKTELAFNDILGAAKAFRKDFDGKPEEFTNGRMLSEIEVIRFDEKVLSICETIDAFYPGAAHGMVGYAAANYDTATGNKLAVTDVISDMAGAKDYVAEHLTAVDGTAIEVDKDLLGDYFAENGDLQQYLVWLLDEDGVIFRFEPSALTAYAAGTLEAKIPFAECPDLFTPEWK